MTQTPEEIRERNRIQASRQVPAGDLDALKKHKEKYPWADITPPETVEPHRTPEQIEAENLVRLKLADLRGRMSHGDRKEE